MIVIKLLEWKFFERRFRIQSFLSYGLRNNKRDTCKICWPFIELFSIAIRRCAIRTIGMSENLCSRHLVKQKWMFWHLRESINFRVECVLLYTWWFFVGSLRKNPFSSAWCNKCLLSISFTLLVRLIQK